MTTLLIRFDAPQCPIGKVEEAEDYAATRVKLACDEVTRDIAKNFGFPVKVEVSLTSPMTVMIPRVGF